MRYFKAIPQEDKPYVLWQLVADNEAELLQLGLNEDPLILPEDLKPAYVNGVSPVIVKDNELVNLSAEQLRVYGVEYDTFQRVLIQSDKSNVIGNSSFEFKGMQFPMNETARLHYSVIARKAKNYKVLQLQGIYDLSSQDIPDFIDAYYNKLETITQP